MRRPSSQAKGLASSAAAPRRGQFSRCLCRSYSLLPNHLAVELPAACRKALPSTRTAAGHVLQQVTEEAPAPVSVRPKGATETGIARRPESHAPRGFAAFTQRVKTHEKPLNDRVRGRPQHQAGRHARPAPPGHWLAIKNGALSATPSRYRKRHPHRFRVGNS